MGASGKQKSAPGRYPLNWRPWRARKRKDNNRRADGTNHLRHPSNSVRFLKTAKFPIWTLFACKRKIAICLAGCPPQQNISTKPMLYQNVIIISKFRCRSWKRWEIRLADEYFFLCFVAIAAENEKTHNSPPDYYSQDAHFSLEKCALLRQEVRTSFLGAYHTPSATLRNHPPLCCAT